MLRQFLLAVVLIAVPTAAFATFEVAFVHRVPPVPSLGDLSNLKAIAHDVLAIARTGNLEKAGKRITDFETQWDQAEAAMRPLNGDAWGTIDDAADEAIDALRKKAPDAGEVERAVSGLIAALDDPYSASGSDQGGARQVSGIPVTDDTGRPLACEAMIKDLRGAIDAGRIPGDKTSAASDFLSRAIERCNADDDAHADEFSAQGLSLAKQG